MSSRPVVRAFVVAFVVAFGLFAAACAAPYYAQFAPLPDAVRGARVVREAFSIVVPDGFRQRDEAESAAVRAFEEPPANGEHRLFRRLDVDLVAPMELADGEAMAQQALALLRQARIADGLEEQETGAVTLAGRDSWFLRGRVRGPSAGWRLEVLDFLVPGATHSVRVQCTIPDGQLAASRAGFLAIAATLQTTLAAPSEAVGAQHTFDGGRLSLRLPATWTRADDEAAVAAANGTLATFVREPAGARCDLSAVTIAGAVSGAAWLDQLRAGYLEDRGAEWPGLQVLAVERRQLGPRTLLRLRSAYRDGGETVVVDDSYAVEGTRVDRLLFRTTGADYRADRAGFDRAVASLRWR